MTMVTEETSLYYDVVLKFRFMSFIKLFLFILQSMETGSYEYGLMCILSTVQLLDLKKMPEM